MPPGFRNLTVFISANVTGLTAGLGRASAQVRTFGAEATRVGTTVAKAEGQMKQGIQTASKWALALGAAGALGLAAATREAIQFEREMRNVNTIMRQPLPGGGQRRNTEEEFQRISQAVVDMSRTVPQSAEVLARGLYNITSSGFQGAEAMTVLRTAAMAASAGLTTTDTAARAITATLNAYGQGAESAARVSDVLFQTVNLGVVSFEELAQNLGDFVGMAGAANISLEELSSGYATMTLAGLPAAEAATSMNRVVQSFIKPSEAMSERLAQLGFASGQAAIDQLGFARAVQVVTSAAEGNLNMMTQLFPEIRAARGAFALAAGGGALFNEVLGQMTDEEELAQATQRAFNEQAKATGFQLELARNQITATAIELGDRFVPAVASVVRGVAAMFLGFSSIPGPLRTMATLAGVGVTALLLLGGAFGLLAPKILIAVNAMRQMAGAAPVTMAAIGRVGMVLGIAGAALAAYTFLVGQNAQKKAEAEARAQTYADALRQEGAAADEAAAAIVRKNLAETGAIDAATSLGISAKDLVDAILGEEDAIRRVNAALDEYERHIGQPNRRGERRIDMDRVSEEQVRATVKVREAINRESQDRQRAANIVRQENAAKGENAETTDKLSGLTREARAELEALGITEDELAAKGLTAAEAQEQLADAVAMFQGVAQTLDAAEQSANQQAQATRRSSRETKTATQREIERESALLGIERAEMRVTEAERDLADVRSDVAAQREMIRLEREIERAMLSSIRAAFALLDAERALEDSRRRRESGRDVAEAEHAVARAREAQQEAIESLARAEDKLFMARDHGTDIEISESEQELAEARRRITEAGWAAQDAEVALQRVRDDAGANRAIIDAQTSLAEARLSQRDAADAVGESERALTELRAQDRTLAIRDAELSLREAVLGVKQAHEQLRDAQTDTSGQDAAATANDKVTLSLDQMRAAMDKAIQDQLGFRDNLAEVARVGPPGLAAALSKMGERGIAIAAELRGRSAEEHEAMWRSITGVAFTQGEAWQGYLAAVAEGGQRQFTYWNAEMIRKTADTLGVGIGDLMRILQGYGAALASEVTQVYKLMPDGTVRVTKAGYEEEIKAKGGGTFRARGGIDATILTAPTVIAGERSTGKEAYVPMRGISRGRALGILGEAASWYDADVIPMLRGGVMSPDGIPLPRIDDRLTNASVHSALQIGGHNVGDVLRLKAAAELVRAAQTYADDAGFSGGRGSGKPGSYSPAMLWARGQIWNQFGRMTVGGYRATGSVRTSDHPRWRAWDYMVGRNRGLGDAISSWYLQNARQAELKYLIWHDRINTGSGWRSYRHPSDPSGRNPTLAHRDHVHASHLARGGIMPVGMYDGGGYLPQGWSLAGNFTGRPEPVGAAAGAVHHHWRIEVTQTISPLVDGPALADVTARVIKPAIGAAFDEFTHTIRAS